MTTLIELPALPAPINELWHVLLDLGERLTAPWSVIGGQMVLLHVLEHGQVPPQVSQDGDVIADIRSDATAITAIVAQLGALGFELDGISADGLAHRYTRDAEPRRVVIDVLAPEGVGERANLQTSPPGPNSGSARRDAGACAHREGDNRSRGSAGHPASPHAARGDRQQGRGDGAPPSATPLPRPRTTPLPC